METISVAFSQLARDPSGILDRLDHAPNGQIRLEFRDGDSVLLVSDDKLAADTRIANTAARFFAELLKTDDGARQLLRAFTSVFPWVTFLAAEGARQFVHEFVETAYACASVDNHSALDALVTTWRHTAENRSGPQS